MQTTLSNLSKAELALISTVRDSRDDNLGLDSVGTYALERDLTNALTASRSGKWDAAYWNTRTAIYLLENAPAPSSIAVSTLDTLLNTRRIQLNALHATEHHFDGLRNGMSA